MSEAYVVLDDQLGGTVRRYTKPAAIITAHKASEIAQAFASLQRYHQDGYHLAGYFAYEMGYALEPKLAELMPENFDRPLLQIGVFKGYSTEAIKPCETSTPPSLNLKPLWNEADYLSRYDRVKAYIEAGDVYQINLCFPMFGNYGGTAMDLYRRFRSRQPVRYGGVVSLGGDETPDIISLSPELFFKREGDTVTMRPMKGTTARADDPKEDARLAQVMKADAKSQAENLMIVDLLRNDLSRIAAIGTVKTPELYTLESYPTLHQMTSVVRAKLAPNTDFTQMFKSLFPCGSVTGAPKIRAMEIIRELEPAPRGAYCGAMGYIDPSSGSGADNFGGGNACFNVGIRTLILEGGKLRYNVGSGVVMDSDGAEEYRECLLKADVVRSPFMGGVQPDLIETLHCDDGVVAYRGLHVARLRESAKALGYALDEARLETVLNDMSEGGASIQHQIQHLRLTLSAQGKINYTRKTLAPLSTPLKLAISKNPLTPLVQESRYKVSARDFYDGERARLKALCGADEVLFLNPRGELCEGSFTSLFIGSKTGRYKTPSLSCGLLPGVLRAAMLTDGSAREAVLGLADLDSKNLRGGTIFMGNALRGLMRAELISKEPQ